MSEVASSSTSSNDANWESFLQAAEAREAAGDLAGAAEMYEQGIRAHPAQATLHNTLGWTLEQLGKFDAAFAAYDQAVALEPADVQSRVNLARLLEQRDRPDEALKHIEELIRRGAPNSAACEGMRRLCRGQLLDREAGSLSRAGRETEADEKHHAAIAEYDAGIAAVPAAALLYCRRGRALGRVRQAARGLKDLRRAVELDPALADAWHARGLFAQTLNHKEEAIASLGEAARLEPWRAAHVAPILAELQPQVESVPATPRQTLTIPSPSSRSEPTAQSPASQPAKPHVECAPAAPQTRPSIPNPLAAMVRRVAVGLGMIAAGIALIAFAVFLVNGVIDGNQFRGVVKPLFSAVCALLIGAFLALCGVGCLFAGDDSQE